MRILKSIVATVGFAACMFAVGCGSNVVVEPLGAPSITAVLPQTVAAGSSSLTMKVTGSNFTQSAVILWNGNKLTTSMVDANTLSGSIQGGSLAVPGTAQVQVQNVQTGQASQSVPISIVSSSTTVALPLNISTSSLPAGQVGTAYSAAMNAAGGTAAYTWSVAAGALPSGLTLSASTGSISGTPTTSGTFSFTVSVSDSSSPVQTQTAAMSISIAAAPTTTAALVINTSSLAHGTVGTSYAQTLQASGGTPAYVWSISSGSLPAGLTLSSHTGAISGTPTANGTFSFTVSVSDSSSPVQTQAAAMSISVAAAATQTASLAITTSSLAHGTVGTSYAQTLEASGGTPAYVWSISSGSLPAGLTLSSHTGAISGTPTANGTFSFTVSVSDSSSPVQTQTAVMSIVVAAAPVTTPALAITTSSLARGTFGTSYAQTLQASGGTPAYVWSISSGSLPTGLSLAPATGVISGIPTASGSSSFTIEVKDHSNPVQSQSVSLSMTVVVLPLTITSTSLPNGSIGTAYSQSLQASGGISPYTWSVSSGSLPAGLTLSASGVLAGIPTANGTSKFTVTAVDSNSPAQNTSVSLALVVAPPPLTITPSTLATGTINSVYSGTLQATGGTAPYTWSISSGSLPAGLTLSSSNGVISGTPTGDGVSNFTVTVTDTSSPVQTQSATTSITIDPATSGPGNTWFVRPDGGTRYSANAPTGQCNGMYDASYASTGGTGVNQNCAFNDVRYLWSDNTGAANAWVISGGDTVVIRGCTALSSQVNASNPDCRLGYDSPQNGNQTATNQWCQYGTATTDCWNPTIPAGTAAQPTRILGGCAYGTYSCTPINNNYPYGKTNETQLFGGFDLYAALNLRSTSYVQIEGIELTAHNGVCTSNGYPSYPRQCSTSVPYDDFAQSGFWTNNATSNITLQDVYVHGFNFAGLFGPIGGPITMTRVFVGFNSQAGWMFDDGLATPDAAGSSITASYVTMIFNGCYEQYPITATYPAQVCYDPSSGGFGDSWSGQGTGSGGQNSELSSFICDHCVDDYNTKDGFIGPHIDIPHLVVTNSVSIGNMGQNWKWGGDDAYPNTTTFENNLTVSNCMRMSQPMNGVPSTYNQYLSNFCRAGGNGLIGSIPTGSTWNIINNTFITAADVIALDIQCAGTDTSCPSTVNSTNNIFLGYSDPATVFGPEGPPTVYYFSAGSNGDAPETGIQLNVTNTVEYGMTKGACQGFSLTPAAIVTNAICKDPLLTNEPSQPWPAAESDLDVFNPFVSGNSFYPSDVSPIVSAGISVPGLTTDYYGTTRPNPPSIGAVQP